jgi:hypothetical protein
MQIYVAKVRFLVYGFLTEALQITRRDSSYKLFKMSSMDFTSDLVKSICEHPPPESLDTGLASRKWLTPSDGTIGDAVLELSPGNRTFVWPQDCHVTIRRVEGWIYMPPRTTFYTTSNDGWVPYFTTAKTAEINNQPGPHGLFPRVIMSGLIVQGQGQAPVPLFRSSTPARPRTNGHSFSRKFSPPINLH